MDVASLGTLVDDKDGARLGTLLADKDGVRLGTSSISQVTLSKQRLNGVFLRN